MAELKTPCPFCGGTPEVIDIAPRGFSKSKGAKVQCTRCKASSNAEFGFVEYIDTTRSAAVMNWERRVAVGLNKLDVAKLFLTTAVHFAQEWREKYGAAEYGDKYELLKSALYDFERMDQKGANK